MLLMERLWSVHIGLLLHPEGERRGHSGRGVARRAPDRTRLFLRAFRRALETPRSNAPACLCSRGHLPGRGHGAARLDAPARGADAVAILFLLLFAEQVVEEGFVAKCFEISVVCG